MGYTRAMQAELGGAISQSIYYVPNIKGGANTVTVTFNQSAASPDIRVLEYSGLNTASPLDATAVGSGNGTAASSGSASTTSANELIFGANTVYTGTRSAGTGFTSRTITSDGDIAEDEDVSTTGSYSASATLSSAGNWVMQMATFKATTTSGTSVYADVAYAPFGQAYVPSGASDLSFTGQTEDTVSGIYDFLLRQYHPGQGRWLSPDPAGLAAVDLTNPQSWNRYAYVGNGPLSATDALGLFTDAVSNPIEGNCQMNGFDVGCGVMLAFAGMGGGGESGVICHSDCDNFNNGKWKIGADNSVWEVAVDFFRKDCNGPVGGGIAGAFSNCSTQWIASGLMPLGTILNIWYGQGIQNPSIPRRGYYPYVVNGSTIASRSQPAINEADAEVVCTISALNAANGMGMASGLGPSGSESVGAGVTFSHNTGFGPRPINPDAADEAIAGPLAAPGIPFQAARSTCMLGAVK
jgi:RHS repeat-associated protein